MKFLKFNTGKKQDNIHKYSSSFMRNGWNFRRECESNQIKIVQFLCIQD